MSIAHAHRLSEIYADPAVQAPRYKALLTKFAQLYDAQSPDIVVRSPGRVNIIGDHVDYSHFSVLPMAVTSDVVMAVGVDESPKTSHGPASIHIANTEADLFPGETFDVDNSGPLLVIDATKSSWINYFRCGLRVAQEFLRKQGRSAPLVSMNIVMDGNVPTGSGLSSSAAFVVCATLSVLLANGFTEISKKLLTELSIQCEQHVGVNSGGMDQSASIFGQKNHALFVSFLPELKVNEFAFPDTHPKMCFVIANSLITANKYETGPVNYNLRVVEVTLAARILAKKLDLEIPLNGNLQRGTLRGVLEQYYAKHDPSAAPYGTDLDSSREQLAKMSAFVNQFLGNHKDGYTTEEVAEILDVTPEELKEVYMTQYPVRYEKLQLYKRALHVYEESKRVLDFLQVLEGASTATTADETFASLGKLMNESHDSAAHLFQNSCPELDDICKIALANGSAGSRVTGAGFGGSSVHLVPANKTANLIAALKEQYYAKKFPKITEAELAEALLVSEPGGGTTIVENVSLD